jgi:hypothetical protein
VSTLESRTQDARDDLLGDAEAEQEAAAQRAEDDYFEQRAKADGRAPCPTCRRRRYTVALGGGAVWCHSCDEPATG